MSGFEVFAFVAASFLSLIAWSAWYRDIVSIHRLRVPFSKRILLASIPVICLALFFFVLAKWAATSVRKDPLYICFYMLLGAGWLGGMTIVFPFLGLSAREDILENGNLAGYWAVTCALIGSASTFAGANIGNGPGVEVVLFSAFLSSALFFGLWLILDLSTSVSEMIAIDRDESAGQRLGGFLLGLGILSGWSVAGDWVSASATIRDFLFPLLFPISLTIIAVLIEFVFRKVDAYRASKIYLSAMTAAVYVLLSVISVLFRGAHK